MASTTASSIKTYPTPRELAEMARKNVDQIFSTRGKVESSKVVGNDEFGYSITFTMESFISTNISAIPTMIDGVPVTVVIRGRRSVADQFFDVD